MKHIGAQTTFVNKITKVLMNFLKQNFFGKRIRTGTYFTSIINGKKVHNSDITGKFLSEALIFASTNPQYDYRLFIELQVQYMKIPSSNMLFTEIVTNIQNNFCT